MFYMKYVWHIYPKFDLMSLKNDSDFLVSSETGMEIALMARRGSVLAKQETLCISTRRSETLNTQAVSISGK